MTKPELLNDINLLYDTYLLGQIYLEVSKENWTNFHNKVITGGAKLPFQGYSAGEMHFQEISHITKLMSEQPGFNPLVIHHERSIKRAYVRESFELISKYANDTGQFPLWKQQTIFKVGRILRNTVSHKNAELISFPNEYNGQTITWRTQVYDQSKDKTPVFFKQYDVALLHNDQIDAINNTLT